MQKWFDFFYCPSLYPLSTTFVPNERSGEGSAAEGCVQRDVSAHRNCLVAQEFVGVQCARVHVAHVAIDWSSAYLSTAYNCRACIITTSTSSHLCFLSP